MLREPGNPSAYSRSRSNSVLDSMRGNPRRPPTPAHTYQELSGDRDDDSSRLSRGLAVHGGNVVRAGLKGQGGELLHDVLRPLHLLALPRQHGAVLVKGSQLCSSTGSIEGLVVVLHESLGGGGAKVSRTEVERKREDMSARRFAGAFSAFLVLEKKNSQL